MLIMVCLLGISACCGDCNENYLGEFVLNNDSEDYIAFAVPPSPTRRIFADSLQNSVVLNYERPEFVVELEQINCTEERSQCGGCCDEYNAQAALVKLESEGGEIQFNMVLRKDFLNHTPTDPVADIGDILSISLNNQLAGELFINETQLVNRLELGGRQFTRVFAVESTRELPPDSREPAAFYYTQEQGIVAYRLANGEEYVLQQ
ncbi:MAG: hypothetical protein AAGI38_22830 [Bacteroidota bacterium]